MTLSYKLPRFTEWLPAFRARLAVEPATYLSGFNLKPAVERGAEAQPDPPGEPSFLCKPIQLKQLHSASTRNRRI